VTALNPDQASVTSPDLVGGSGLKPAPSKPALLPDTLVHGASALCRSGDRATHWIVGLDTDAFYTAFRRLGEEHLLFPEDLVTYVAGGLRRYSAILPVDFTTYLESGQRMWAGIFRSGIPHTSWARGYDEAAFLSLCADQVKRGYRPIDVTTYVDGGERKWAGIFGRKARTTHWQLRTPGNQTAWDNIAQRQLAPLCVVPYLDDGEWYFAMLLGRSKGDWRFLFDRDLQGLRSQVDGEFEARRLCAVHLAITDSP
jgi:hypothetical protein